MTPLAIYTAHQAELYRFALSLCQDAHLAQDLVQTTFLRVCEHADDLEAYPPGRIQGWLFLTLRRAWIDLLRRRRSEDLSDDLPQAGQEADFTGFQVMMALDKLPEPLRETVVLRHFMGLNATQIGKRLHTPAATVRTRLRTAAKQLKTHYWDEEC